MKDEGHLAKMETPSLDTLRALKVYLSFSWAQIEFYYDDLTPNERRALTREQFDELVRWVRS